LALDATDQKDKEILDSWTEEFSFGFCPVDRGKYHNAFRNRKGD